MRDSIFKMITDIVDNAVDMCISDEQIPKRAGMSDELNSVLLPIIPLEPMTTEDAGEALAARTS